MSMYLIIRVRRAMRSSHNEPSLELAFWDDV